MQKLHVVLAIDRAGLVGEDGETHHGVFDVGFLRQAPGMKILCPANTAELQTMLEWATLHYDGPVSIRYPRGGNGEYTEAAWSAENPVVVHAKGTDCAIVTYGKTVNNALAAAKILATAGVSVSVIRIGEINPIPFDCLADTLRGIPHVVVLEEVCSGSGIFQDLVCSLHEEFEFSKIDLGDWYPTHGPVDELYKYYGLDAQSIVAHIQEVLKVEN